MSKVRVVYWFRTDLRLHDSPALKAALDLKPDVFWPIWIWDPHYVYKTKAGSNRWKFLIECQNEVSKKITQINKKSKLFVIREAPQTIFPKLFKAWNITHLVFEKDTDPYSKERDALVMMAAKVAGVEVLVRSGRTLWDSDELVKKNNNRPTMSITQVQNAGPKLGKIPRPFPAPTAIPDPGETTVTFEHEPPLINADLSISIRESDEYSFKNIAGPLGDFSVPTLEELGLPMATSPHQGGEKIALEMLEKIIADEKYTATFEKPNTSPTAFEPQSTTLLSSHLHFGSLGIREFYWRVQDTVDGFKGKASQPPVSLVGQLLFREMYFGAHAALSHSFSQTLYNSHCRFVPWHLQSKVDPSSKRATGEYHIDSPQAEEWFQRWKYGRTGFPWIDALMRQLRQEGWIHHLGRHAVACFLTRGGCYISWERGAEVFEELLLDHERACNAGNWQWLSCTAFFTQYFRCYSPIAFPQKYDKHGVFVRKYVPELQALNEKYIYEPWKAPRAEQQRAGVVIADSPWDSPAIPGHYPKPMFDFAARRTICMSGMKEAYKMALFGNDPKVLDGSWRELLAGDVPPPGDAEVEVEKENKTALEAKSSRTTRELATKAKKSRVLR
ncbi:Putative Cryptochrome protein [Blumeria hordei DH14]|uniref:Putative Cryptochrome protein n=1 Tax=Blumeria graminis f. sp. hordei (strain DH14) TaxID=546991 RepID=N1JD34_BLUG1|nr:Putative Cryptochrome protein [Blumeria hordei DH14]